MLGGSVYTKLLLVGRIRIFRVDVIFVEIDFVYEFPKTPHMSEITIE